MIVHLRPEKRSIIQQSAAESYPDECCGLISGIIDGENIHVRDIHPSPNITKGDPRRGFEVDPKLRFDLMRSLEVLDDGTSIIGHFHSHPDSPAEPSATDLTMAYEPDMIWLICSINTDKAFTLGAFRLNETKDGFDPLEIRP